MLLYLSSNSRPDIQFVVHQCARFTHSPRASHAAAIKRIMRYLQGTTDKGISIAPDVQYATSIGTGKEPQGVCLSTYTGKEPQGVCLSTYTGKEPQGVCLSTYKIQRNLEAVVAGILILKYIFDLRGDPR